MNTVRVGLIGMGNIGRHHAAYLLDGRVPRCQLTAVCSTSPQKLQDYAGRGLKVFGDAAELLRSGACDAALIATPHPEHTTLGLAAFAAGLHVMVEKPIAAHKADAERLIAAARARPGQKFAAMFQLRVEPRYLRMRKLIQEGELGRILRVNWINTDWFRTEAYYASGGWRATWKGEGGGVLINQCLHNLDTLQWLLGLPARVRGFCRLGRFHTIEVEDDATAWLEWPDGASGVFTSNTGETPGTNRFEIAGSRGRLVLENNKLTFTRNEADCLDYSRSAKSGFAKPEVWQAELPFENAAAPHATLMQNFVEAILDGAPLIAPGEQGLGSVELANAILYSSLLDRTLDLPFDAAAYERKLNELIAGSKLEKKVIQTTSDDFAKSFRR